MTVTRLPPTLSEAVDQFLHKHGRTRPVRLKKLARAVRKMSPELQMSEAELETMLAFELVAKGANIAFGVVEELPIVATSSPSSASIIERDDDAPFKLEQRLRSARGRR